jgi:Uma2 family endonuclease
MAIAVPPAGPVPERYTAERYLALIDEGVLGPDDRVELLEGVIVAMAPQSPRHAAAASRVSDALRAAVSTRAAVRDEKPFMGGPYSVPEPDVAVIPGRHADYEAAHPSRAVLLVEASDSSLVQDRLTKTAIYAAAGVPEYWIINLRDDCVEVFQAPDPEARVYTRRRIAGRGDELTLVALPDARVLVDDLLPARQR